MPRPNLFSYATSELSQDAVLCWLLAWADPEMARVDDSLHQLGRSFLDALSRAAAVEVPPAGASVAITRQAEKVDVVALVGDEHVVMIEDKTLSREHSDQLRRYEKAIQKKYPRLAQVRVCVTTGDEDGYQHIRQRGWGVMRRVDLLDVLRPCQSTNAILIDFREHLERIEAAVQCFRTKPPADWARRDDAWKGLFTEIQSRLGTGWWHYVDNRSGGFMGFWWGNIDAEGCQVYLELHEEVLAAKIDVEAPARRRELRDRWSSRLVRGTWRRPKRFGHGRWMTVAEHGEYRVWRGGALDLEATVALLRATTDEVHRLVRAHR